MRKGILIFLVGAAAGAVAMHPTTWQFVKDVKDVCKLAIGMARGQVADDEIDKKCGCYSDRTAWKDLEDAFNKVNASADLDI